MDAFSNMLAVGWPLALIGFVLGIITNAMISSARRKEANAADEEGVELDHYETPVIELAPGEDGYAALEAELKTARQLMAAEENDAEEITQNLKSLDEAIKRANGRLKLLTKAVNRTIR